MLRRIGCQVVTEDDTFTLADVKAAMAKMREAQVPTFDNQWRFYLTPEEWLRYRAAQRYMCEVSYGRRYNAATGKYERVPTLEEYVEEERLRDAREDLLGLMAYRCAMLGQPCLS